MRTVQKFEPAYLERCSSLEADEILRFLEDFKTLHQRSLKPARSRLISIKIPQNLLDGFKRRCQLEGVRYQTQIKELMRDYLTR